MRSSGYFHVSRETLQQILQTSFKDNCSFLSEREAEEYFDLYHKDHKELMNYVSTQVNQRLKRQQGNTELVDRNEPDEDTQELLKGKGKDPYPWLDAEDPRRKMTDQEILEKYIDLSDSDLDLVLHYPDVYQPCKPVILQQTQVPNSLLMGINYVDYEPQGTEVIQACLQTTSYKGWPQWFSSTPE